MDTKHTISRSALSDYWRKLGATSQSEAKRQVEQRKRHLEDTWLQSLGVEILNLVYIEIIGVEIDKTTKSLLDLHPDMTGDIRFWDISEADVIDNRPQFTLAFNVFPRYVSFKNMRHQVAFENPTSRFWIFPDNVWTEIKATAEIDMLRGETATIEGVPKIARLFLAYDDTAPHAQDRVGELYQKLVETISSDFQNGSFQRRMK